MPATLHELFAGRSETLGTNPRAEIAYVVLGAADEAEVRAVATAGIPATYQSIPRRSITLTERLNASTWTLSALFEYASGSDSGGTTQEAVLAFDTTGGSQHITQSLQTVGRYGPGSSTRLGGAIGVDGERVAGVDITVPVYQFSEMHFKHPGSVDSAYRRTVMELTGTVNQGPFREWAAGECLFLGASGQRRGTGDWELTYRFAVQPNRVNLAVGDISGISKDGWDYLWVQNAPDLDDSAGVIIRSPVAAYVEQVYARRNFTALDLN
jgi:hypothetical protein